MLSRGRHSGAQGAKLWQLSGTLIEGVPFVGSNRLVTLSIIAMSQKITNPRSYSSQEDDSGEKELASPSLLGEIGCR